jgi:glutathione synthase/RimK-type ligase-like ATP-grasp enzyme
MTVTVALATCKALPALDDDDHGLIDELSARSARVSLPVWNDPAADWNVDVVVVRSTWDYSTQRDAFIAWARRIESTTTLCNDASMLAWNTDKRRYLTTLEEQGVPTVPTLWLDKDAGHEKQTGASFRSAARDLAQLVRETKWSRTARAIVVKPTVGAGARDTAKFSFDELADRAQRFVDGHRPHQSLMVQPFLPGIEDGEVSLVFLENTFSHAVRKTPANGDFRSQPEFGSRVVSTTPTSAERSLAEKVLEVCGGNPLYARVDLVRGLEGQPCLIELELTEPSLYLGWADGSARLLAEAVMRRAEAARQRQLGR